jgi:hypothetical protein
VEALESGRCIDAQDPSGGGKGRALPSRAALGRPPRRGHQRQVRNAVTLRPGSSAANVETRRSARRRCVGLRAPRFSRFDLPLPQSPLAGGPAPGAKRRRSTAGDPASRNVVASRRVRSGSRGLICPAAALAALPASRARSQARSKRGRSTIAKANRAHGPRSGSRCSWGTTMAGNRAFPRAARATRGRQSRAECRSV